MLLSNESHALLVVLLIINLGEVAGVEIYLSRSSEEMTIRSTNTQVMIPRRLMDSLGNLSDSGISLGQLLHVRNKARSEDVLVLIGHDDARDALVVGLVWTKIETE